MEESKKEMKSPLINDSAKHIANDQIQMANLNWDKDSNRTQLTSSIAQSFLSDGDSDT